MQASGMSTCGKCFGASLNAGDWPNLADVAHHIGKDLRKLGLEDLWSCIDYYAKFTTNRGGFLADPGWLCGAVWELKRALLSVYGHACNAAARSIHPSTACTLLSLLKRVQPRDTVISFDWDTLVERLARKLRLRLRHGSGPAKGTEIRFAKPHGSVSWRVRGLHPPVSGAPLLDCVTEPSVICGCSRTEPLLLGAVPIKSELIAEVQYHWGACDVFEVIMRQWQTVVEAIREADVIVVAGYSFPKEDHHGRFLFSEGVRHRTKRLKRVEYYNVSRESESAIREIFGEACKVVPKGPVKAVSRSIRRATNPR